ncbi:MAG: ComEC/Rec2 family competence protein [Planctomycetes bacterium]|nr:ComEC/Rec2 family competence protein [Planctomycetota bacterium]
MDSRGQIPGDVKSSVSRQIRAPLAPVAIALACGIAAGRYIHIPAGLWAVIAVGSLAAGLATFRFGHLRIVTISAILACVSAIGAICSHLAWYSVPAGHIVTWTGESASLATIRGKIVSSPILDEQTGPAIGYRREPRTIFLLQTTWISTNKGGRETCGTVRVTVDQPAMHLSAGQQVELVGKMGRFHPPSNPGQFDSLASARLSGVLVWFTVPASQGAVVLGGPENCIERAFWNIRAAARQQMACQGGLEGGPLLNALITGERSPALRQLNRAMMQAGTAHYLSISGSHLAIFLGFAYLLCRLAGLRPARAAGVVLVVLTAYLLLAEPNAPLMRSAIMAGCVCLAAIFQRRPSGLNALSAAAAIILFIDPLQLFDAGFQLSFSLVLGFILLHKPVRRLLFGRWLARRGLAVFRGSGSTIRRLRRAAAWRLMDGLTVMLTAYVVSIPLVAHHFGLFSPYAIVLNVILAPLVIAVLVPGYISLALAWPMPGLAGLFGKLAGLASDGLAWTVMKMSELPGLCMDLYPVGAVWVALCYAAIAMLFLRNRIRFASMAGAVCLVAAVILAIVSQMAAAPPATAELHVLDVGAGQCVVLRGPSGKTFIFDCGSRSGFDIYQQVLRPFLRRMRLPTPHEAFVSHANTDHYNGLAEMIRNKPSTIGKVYLNDYFSLAVPAGQTDQPTDLPALIARQGLTVHRVRTGQTIRLDERTTVEVLWPPEQFDDKLAGPAHANDSSLVLKITCDGRSVLLTGDIETGAQERLAAGQPDKLKADAMILPHHGSFTQAIPGLVDAVGPAVVIASQPRQASLPAQADDMPVRPADEFFAALRPRIKYFSTASNGYICVQFGAGRIDVFASR